MPSVQYGSRLINYSFQEKEGLAAHYISVEKQNGVVLKGSPVLPEKADQLVLKKARWIIKKLQLVNTEVEEPIVTGSRLTYLGRSYYVEVIMNSMLDNVNIEFNYSRFKIHVPEQSVSQSHIKSALEVFYKTKAVEKLRPRVLELSSRCGLPIEGLRLRKMNKRWGSCTADNNIILNPEAVKLPYSLIDYLIVHELCHTKVKDHSKAFWAEVSRHVNDWRRLDEMINETRL